MRKFFVVIAVGTVLSLGGDLWACENPRFTLSIFARNYYLNRPGIDLYKNTVGGMEVNLACGPWEAGVWSSMGLGKSSFLEHNLGNELDIYVGARKRIGYLEFYGRVSYFNNDIVSLDSETDDQWILDGEVALKYFSWITPYASIRRFGEVGEHSPREGLFGWLGLRGALPLWLGQRKFPLDLDLQLAFSNGPLGPRGKDGGFIYGRLYASYKWNLPNSDRISLIPHMVWQVADGSQHGGPRDYAKDRHAFMYGLTLQIRSGLAGWFH